MEVNDDSLYWQGEVEGGGWGKRGRGGNELPDEGTNDLMNARGGQKVKTKTQGSVCFYFKRCK